MPKPVIDPQTTEHLTRNVSRQQAGEYYRTMYDLIVLTLRTDMTRVVAGKAQGDWAAQIPLGRLGAADDVAAAACYLASDEAAYITGHVLAVNGGMYM